MLAATADVSATTLPAGYGYEWTGTAYQGVAASGETGPILGLTILFAFPFLVGPYESWMMPVPVLLSVPVRERSSARFRRLRSRPGETD